ncbi:MAG: cyanophycinase [Cyclobacteriaceae bacterium]|nr:cyanophycinase [Cyclobacteriaceae bacterium]MCH8515918.1 cyanophycinase [Cyclobacteriaceae bacterium]
MKQSISIYFGLLILLIVACESPDNKVNRGSTYDVLIPPKEKRKSGNLFIIGGGSRPEALLLDLIKVSGLDKEDEILILPTASQEPDSSYWYAAKQFKELGYENTDSVIIEKGVALPEEMIERVKKSKLLYICGGDQNRIMKEIQGTGLLEAIHQSYENGNTIAGTSAGAAVMSRKMITGNELRHSDYHSTFRTIESENIEIKEGLGLLEWAIIDQHFLIRSRHNRLLSAVIEHPEALAIGIDESTALVVQQDSIWVSGVSQIITFQANPNQKAIVQEGKLGARDLRIQLYLPGERLDNTQ